MNCKICSQLTEDKEVCFTCSQDDDDIICSDCLKTCKKCNLATCSKCGVVTNCLECGNNFCSNCMFIECRRCGDSFWCDACIKKTGYCSPCYVLKKDTDEDYWSD